LAVSVVGLVVVMVFCAPCDYIHHSGGQNDQGKSAYESKI